MQLHENTFVELVTTLEDIGWQLYLGILLLLACSAFFSASETAFSTVNTIRLKHAAEEGNKKAALALKITEMYDKTLSSILIGNNLVNIALSSIATVIFVALLKSNATLISTIVTTIVVLIFCEILPKTYAKEHNEKVALAVAGILYAVIWVFTPVSVVFTKMQNAFIRLFRSPNQKPSVTEEELKFIVETIQNEGVLEQEEKALVQSALDFDETAVEKIAIPRVDMSCIDIEDDIDSILNEVIPERYSRIPVYEHSIDKMIGVLYTRDLLEAMVQHGKDSLDIRALMRECLFVHRSMKIAAVFSLLQKQKQHIAIVTDDYGGTYGLVTMEDILEELVGEIYDESDEDPEEIVCLEQGVFEVPGEMDLDDLFKEIGYKPASFESDYHTVGGWVLEMLKHIPEPLETFAHDRLKVTVLEMEEQRIMKLRLELLHEQAGQADLREGELDGEIKSGYQAEQTQ